jgi:hypothetical protein
MYNSEWIDLRNLLHGKKPDNNLTGFIIDRLLMPIWYGISKIEYYSSDEFWLKSNLKPFNSISEVWFLPSFLLEYGICIKSLGSGSRKVFLEKNLTLTRSDINLLILVLLK